MVGRPKMIKIRPLVLKNGTGKSLSKNARPEHLSGNPIFGGLKRSKNDPKIDQKGALLDSYNSGSRHLRGQKPSPKGTQN